MPLNFVHGNDLSNLWKGTVGCEARRWARVRSVYALRREPQESHCWPAGQVPRLSEILRASPESIEPGTWARLMANSCCHHWDIVAKDGGSSRCPSQRDVLLEEMRAATEPGAAFDSNVRFPTPHLRAAVRDAAGVPFDSKTNYTDLDERQTT